MLGMMFRKLQYLEAFQFQHTGFNTVIEQSQDNVPANMSEEELLINGLGKINPLLAEISFQDFFNVDSVVICTEEIPDVEIIAHILNEKKELLSDFEEEYEITNDRLPNKQLNGCQD